VTDRVYCTCFDRNYLSRGLALYHSLQRHAPGSRLWVLCLDQACYELLARLALPNLVAVSLGAFEAADRGVAAARSNRSLIEYYFTCTPAWLLYVLEREASSQWVTYLDGDLFFFDSPEKIFGELENAAFGIIPHRYTPETKHMRKYGVYNVGWVGARNDPDGTAAVKWWREKCIEWCYDYVDGDRFADQGYLEELSTRFPRVKVIENIGANLAPWNIGNYRVEFGDDKVLVDSTYPLIFFHFQGFKREMGCFIFNSHRLYRAPFSKVVRDHVYRPYVDELLAIEQTVGSIVDVATAKPLQRKKVDTTWNSAAGAARNVGKRLLRLLDIATGRVFIVFRGKAY
jgi:hypothetical protein